MRQLPEDADALVGFAEAIATVLSEKDEELGISRDVEALLRASIAAATFAIDSYAAVVAGGKKSLLAHRCMAEAKRRCYRSVDQLRRRVTRSISHLCRLMEEKDFSELSGRRSVALL